MTTGESETHMHTLNIPETETESQQLNPKHENAFILIFEGTLTQ